MDSPTFYFATLGALKRKQSQRTRKKKKEKSGQAKGALIFCHAAPFKAQLVKNPPAIQEALV